MSKAKLKPCPFCGGKAFVDNFLTRDDNGEWMNVYSVCCDNELCHYQPFTERYSLSLETAAKRWNTRAKMDEEIENDL